MSPAVCWGAHCCFPATLSPALNQASPEQRWGERLVLRKCWIWIFRMGIVVMQMQAGLSGWAPHLHPRVCCSVRVSQALICMWGLAIVSLWGLHLKSSIWGSHSTHSCKWYIIWYLNWNTFVLVAEEHTRWNSGIRNVIMMLLGILPFAFGWHFVSFQVWVALWACLSLFVLLFPKYEKKQKGNDKDPEFSFFF